MRSSHAKPSRPRRHKQALRAPAPSKPRRDPFYFIDLALAATSGFLLAAAAQRRSDRHALAAELGLPPPSETDDPADLTVVEPGRGRGADRPQQIPSQGWVDIFWRLVVSFFGDRLPQVAGGVAYALLLSIFPAVASFVSLYGLIADLGTVRAQLDALRGVLPPDVLKILGDELARLATAPKSGLTFGFIGGLLIATWTVMGGLKTLFQGLNVAYHETERRGILRVNLLALLMTVGGFVFVALVLGAVVVVPTVLGVLGIKMSGFGLLRWPVLFVLNVIALSVLYRYGPSREHPKWRWVTWGGAFGSALWLLASVLYSWYLNNLANYQATYGSLGAFMGFLIWIWLSALVVLIGAELNAQMEHQTVRDTTIGPEQPMGSRGAIVADTIGARRGAKGAQQFTQAGAEELSRKVMLKHAKPSGGSG